MNTKLYSSIVILLLAVITIFFTEVGFSESNNKWGYFLLPVGTVKTYEMVMNDKSLSGKIIEEYYDETKNEFSEIIIKTREKLIIGEEGSATTNTTYHTYKLDPDTNQVLEVEVENTSPELGFKDSNYTLPKILLALPLSIGKKWDYQMALPERSKQFLENSGQTPYDFAEYERSITGKKMLKVPAGNFEVFIVKEVFKRSGDITYEYYNKDVGLVSRGYFLNKDWWGKRLIKIEKADKADE